MLALEIMYTFLVDLRSFILICRRVTTNATIFSSKIIKVFGTKQYMIETYRTKFFFILLYELYPSELSAANEIGYCRIIVFQ